MAAALRHRWWLVAGAAFAVLALDQLTKWWAVRTLCGPPFCPDRPENLGRTIDLVWTLRFNYAENTGMAFSAGRNSGPLIALVATAIVVVLLFVARGLTSRLQVVLVGIVVGGAVGNLVDRAFRATDGPLSGGVVDFVDLQWWPIFNVADAAVVVGGIALAVTTLWAPRDPEPEPDPGAEPDAGLDPDAAPPRSGEPDPDAEPAAGA